MESISRLKQLWSKCTFHHCSLIIYEPCFQSATLSGANVSWGQFSYFISYNFICSNVTKQKQGQAGGKWPLSWQKTYTKTWVHDLCFKHRLYIKRIWYGFHIPFTDCRGIQKTTRSVSLSLPPWPHDAGQNKSNNVLWKWSHGLSMFVQATVKTGCWEKQYFGFK